MRSLQFKYLFVYTTPFVILFSLWAGNIWSFFALFFIFGLIPFFELFTKGSTYNLNPLEEEEVKNNFMFDLIIYGLVPLQGVILIYFLFQVSDETLPLYEKNRADNCIRTCLWWCWELMARTNLVTERHGMSS